MDPVRLYSAQPLMPGKQSIRLLASLGANEESAVIYKTVPADFALTGFTLVPDVAQADFVIVPQSIKAITPEVSAYLARVRSAAHGKKTIVFLSGDYSDRIHIPGDEFIVFKGSEYKHAMQSNEIAFAPFVEDLGMRVPFGPRGKAARPVVSFCGYAGFTSFRSRAKFELQNALIDLRAFITASPRLGVYKRGIYFRQVAMNALEADPCIDTSFIIRSSFGANAKTIKGDPTILRREYIDSIVNADFVLAPKGDANYSSRFYETLSLGRIPVLIDTDMLLPFEHTIDYSRIVIRVPFGDIRNIGKYIRDFYEPLSAEEFAKRQEEARRVFHEYLRYDAYFNRALPIIKESGIKALTAS